MNSECSPRGHDMNAVELKFGFIRRFVMTFGPIGSLFECLTCGLMPGNREKSPAGRHPIHRDPELAATEDLFLCRSAARVVRLEPARGSLRHQRTDYKGDTPWLSGWA
jgi:hypothetical protein